MVDHELILAKASSVKRHLKRVKQKANIDLQVFAADIDCQDIIIFNLQMAIQNCIDIAKDNINDINEYLKEIFQKLGIGE